MPRLASKFNNMNAVIRMHNDKGETLLLLRATRPYGWGLPGGKLNVDEDPLTACVRETLEETGVELDDPSQLTYIGRGKSIYGSEVEVFEIVLSETPVVMINKREHLNARWIKTHSNEYAGSFTKEIESLQLAGNTHQFLDMNRPVFIPESLR